MYSLELPSRMLHQVKLTLLRGEELLLSIDGGYLHGDRVLYGNSSALKLIEHPFGSRALQKRKLSAPPLEGDLSVIILRITATDAEPTDSAETLYNLTFLSEVSLRSQLYKCSAGKVRLAPTEYGVMEVAVNVSATGNSQYTIINAAYQSALHLIPTGVQDIRSLADFVMLVLPPGTGNWAAFGAIPGQQTAYNDKYVKAIVFRQFSECKFSNLTRCCCSLDTGGLDILEQQHMSLGITLACGTGGKTASSTWTQQDIWEQLFSESNTHKSATMGKTFGILAGYRITQKS